VFGYALLYATSEIGYHFQTGYWRPFDELAHYTSGPGLRSWLDGVSIAVALAGWASAIAFGAARRFTLAIGVALVAATALLITAKKGYFPHYTNLLMPAVMVPVACGLARLQRLVYPAVALAAAAMFASSARYYQDVDALNGLSPTLGMVERAMHEPGPFRVEFEGFQNGFAWQMLVNTKYRRPFDTPRDAPVVFRVKNRAPWAGGDPPSGASLHGPALMERHRR
jgi:hypothetical protein